MLRNLYIVKKEQFFPTLFWVKKTGPGEVSLTATDKKSKTSNQMGENKTRNIMSKIRFTWIYNGGLLFIIDNWKLLPQFSQCYCIFSQFDKFRKLSSRPVVINPVVFTSAPQCNLCQHFYFYYDF
jgi:hypothetical protein